MEYIRKNWPVALTMFLFLLILAVYAGIHAFAYYKEIEKTAVHMTDRQKVEVLKKGDTVGVLAPGSPADIGKYETSVKLLKELGYKVKLAPSVKENTGYLAGSDEDRARDINEFFKDDDVKAIISLRGGYGSDRILSLLDYATIKKHPKMFIGYSDVTALHTVLGEKCNMVTIHGPMISSFEDGKFTDFTLYNFENGLSGSLPSGDIRMPEGKKLETVNPGRASGILVGGNLSVIASMAGTPYELKGDGAILFLEDVREKPYRVDRLMQQLWQSGLLSRVNGIAYGEFTDLSDEESGDEDEEDSGSSASIDDVLAYYGKLSGKPVIKGIPAGHGKDNLFIPLGVSATIDAKSDGSASFRINENYYQEK